MARLWFLPCLVGEAREAVDRPKSQGRVVREENVTKGCLSTLGVERINCLKTKKGVEMRAGTSVAYIARRISQEMRRWTHALPL